MSTLTARVLGSVAALVARAAPCRIAARVAPRADERLREELRALGYIE